MDENRGLKSLLTIQIKTVLRLIVFSLPVCIALHAQPDTLNWDQFNVPSVGRVHSVEGNVVFDFELNDVNHDGQEDIILVRRDPDHPLQIAVRDADKDSYVLLPRPLRLKQPWGTRRTFMIFPLHGHPVYAFLIYDLAERDGWIKFYDRNLELRDSLRTVRGGSQNAGRPWNGYLYQPRLADINGDLRPDLVFLINTASDGQPRMLLAYDLVTKQAILTLKFAPMIQAYHITDFEHDGRVEIVTELIGAGDGPFFGPFRRDESYIAIFSNRGKLLKSWEHAGPATYISSSLYDMLDDGIPDLVITYLALAETDEPSRLQLISGKTLNTEASITCEDDPAGFGTVLWHDEGSGKPSKFVVLSHDDDLRLLSFDRAGNRLQVERVVRNISYSYTDKKDQPFFLDDINTDGVPEILFFDWEGDRIWILKPDLTPLAKVEIKLGPRSAMQRLSRSNREMREYILQNENRLVKLSIPVNDVFPQPALSIHWGPVRFTCPRAALLGILGIFVFFTGGFVWLVFRQHKAVNHAALFNSVRIGAFLLDSGLRFKWANSHFLELCNASFREVRHQHFKQLLNRNHMQPISEQMALFVKTEKSQAHHEIQIGSPGRQRSMALELYRQGTGSIQGMLVDLTESTQTERLRIWSAMAQRVIHKTKTPLGTILLAIQRLQKLYRKRTPEQAAHFDPYVVKAVGEIERVREDINAFMKLARLHEIVLKKNVLNQWLPPFIRDYKTRVPDGVMIQLHADADPLPVQLDPDQFSEALMNILDNAVAAVKGNGLIRLHCQKETGALHAFGAPETALIEIMDNGSGMNQDALSHLFTPGYTTREEGSGLGLLIAKAIIEQHHGDITISSTPDIGTTVCVRLPILKEEEESF